MIIIANYIKLSENYIENLKCKGIDVIISKNSSQFSEDISFEIEKISNDKYIEN